MDLRGRNKVTPEFNMSSMTDIVFLLLIFFMLASTLVTTNAIDILLPKASGKTENKKSIAVSIKKDFKGYCQFPSLIARYMYDNTCSTVTVLYTWSRVLGSPSSKS